MATNCGRLPTTKCWAAVALAALFAAPQSASAEPPKTALEWFNLIHRRNADVYGVRMESTWQRLEDGKLVEEWDQILETDDLGGERVEELGRTRRRSKDNATELLRTIFAFDGNEYRELTNVWVVADSIDRSSALRLMDRSPPILTFGMVGLEPRAASGLTQTLTPQNMADHWFRECLASALADGVTPTLSIPNDDPSLRVVAIDSEDDSYGHKCLATVSPHMGWRVVALDMWDSGRWGTRFEVC